MNCPATLRDVTPKPLQASSFAISGAASNLQWAEVRRAALQST